MALKIYQSSITPKSATVPEATGLPSDAGAVVGNAYKKLGKVIEDIYFEQKDEEDKNRTQDVIDQINPIISENFNKIKKEETNVQLGTAKFNKVMDIKNYDKLLRNENKSVKKKVADYLRSNRSRLALQLGNGIVANSIEKSKVVNDGILDDIMKRATSNNIIERNKANNEFKNFFNSASNIRFYGAKGIEALKSEKQKELLTLKLIRKTKNGEIDLTDNEQRKEILSNYTENEGRYILEKIRAIQTSENFKKDEEMYFHERKTNEARINNFSAILNVIYQSNNDDSVKGKVPSIDDLHDLKALGRINETQYQYLLKAVVNPEMVNSEERMIETINVQLAIADTVEDVEAIQNEMNLNSTVNGLSVKDLLTYNSLLEKYKQDRNFGKEYKYYQDLLKTHVKEVSGFLSTSVFGSNDAAQKIAATNRLNEFNEYIADGKSAEDAYLKTLGNINSSDLPKIVDFPIRNELNLKSHSEFFQKNPDNAFDKLRDKAKDLYLKSGNIKQFQKDIDDLDIMEDIFKVRLKAYSGQSKNSQRSPVELALSGIVNLKQNKENK